MPQQLKIFFGHSTHGSGDLSGLIYTIEYSKKFKPRLSYSVVFGTTIHDGEEPLYFKVPGSQSIINSSIRYSTAGMQGAFNLGYHLINGPGRNLQIQSGALLRYQTSSDNGYNILYSAGTGIDIPVIYFDIKSPQRTFAVGSNL